MTRPFELHVHSKIRQLIQEPALSDLARQTLSDIDMVVNNDDTAFKHTRMLTFDPGTGEPIPIKFVMARGKGFDAIHLTVPKSLDESIETCTACNGIGYEDTARSKICNKCQGLGYLPIARNVPL